MIGSFLDDIPESKRFSALTSCGEVHTDYEYSGTYAYIFTFGAASVYVYYSKRDKFRHYWHIYSKSYIPDNFKPKRVSYKRGFLLYDTDSFEDCILNYSLFVRRFFDDYKSSFDFLKPLDNNYAYGELFPLRTDEIFTYKPSPEED